MADQLPKHAIDGRTDTEDDAGRDATESVTWYDADETLPEAGDHVVFVWNQESIEVGRYWSRNCGFYVFQPKRSTVWISADEVNCWAHVEDVFPDFARSEPENQG